MTRILRTGAAASYWPRGSAGAAAHGIFRRGRRTQTRVPWPFWVSICQLPPMALARSRMLRQPKPVLGAVLRGAVHALAIIRHGQQPVRGLADQADAHMLRMPVAHGIADGLLRDAQQRMLMLRRQAGRRRATLEAAHACAPAPRTVRPAGAAPARGRRCGSDPAAAP